MTYRKREWMRAEKKKNSPRQIDHAERRRRRRQ